MSQSKTSFACASLLGILLASQTNMAGAEVLNVCPDLDCTDPMYSTIQLGITNANPGDTVLVESGRTYVENITMKEGVTVKSEGPDTFEAYTDPYGKTTANTWPVLIRAKQTIIQGSGNDTVVSFPAGTENAVLDGFTVEYNATINTPLIKVEDCSPTIKYNIVRDNEGDGQSGGIEVVGGAGVAQPLIEHNVIHYVNGHGIGVFSKGVPAIVDNEIFTTPPVTFPPSQFNPPRLAPGIGFHNDSAATITANHIFQNGSAGIGSRGSGSDGVYSLPGYGFDIIGNIIHDNTWAAGVYIQGLEGFPTNDINITIAGNSIRDNYVGVNVGFKNNNLSQFFGNVVVQDNDISNSTKAGIWFRQTMSGLIQGNTLDANGMAGIRTSFNHVLTIDGNTITDTGSKLGGAYYGGGIYLGNHALQDSANTEVVTNNTITGGKTGGIRVDASKLKADIRNNTLTGNAYGGIRIHGANYLNIEDNEIADNGRGGIHTGGALGFAQENNVLQAGGGMTLDIHGNKIHGNGTSNAGGGIDVRHASGVIRNNLVYNNQNAGIRFGDWTTEIIYNTVVGNGAGGIIYDSPDGGAIMFVPDGYPPAQIPIQNNVIVGNVVAGINAGTLPQQGGDCDDWEGFRSNNLLSLNNGAWESAQEIEDYYYDDGDDTDNEWDLVLITAATAAHWSWQLATCQPNSEIYESAGFTGEFQTTAVGMGAYNGSDAIDW